MFGSQWGSNNTQQQPQQPQQQNPQTGGGFGGGWPLFEKCPRMTAHLVLATKAFGQPTQPQPNAFGQPQQQQPSGTGFGTCFTSKLARDLISCHHAFCSTQGASPPLLLLLVGLQQLGALAHLPLVGVPLNLPQLSDHLVNQQEEHRAPQQRSAKEAHPCSARVPRRPLLDSQLNQQQVLVVLPHPNVSFSSCLNLSHSPHQIPYLSTAPGTGTASPPYAPFQEKDTAGATTITQHFQTISAMPAYRNYSLEASPPIRQGYEILVLTYHRHV